jgi:cell fate (sporulation/competence/biofilm development) regulator YmcA (YheA/YmcA/DUF963 family)
MLECPDCHESFKNSRSLYNHKSREKKKKRNGLPTCAIRKQYIEENQIVRETIENTSKHEIFQAINTTINMNDLLKENAELKDQLQNKSEEYLKGLANDEIRKLKSHIQGLEKRIQELESYIEERKDVTSKAEDVIRNCKCKMFKGYRQELV